MNACDNNHSTILRYMSGDLVLSNSIIRICTKILHFNIII